MSKRSKISAEDKIRIVKESAHVCLSQSVKAKRIGVDKTVVMDLHRERCLYAKDK